jgi:polysaccharide export outer membrane protein
MKNIKLFGLIVALIWSSVAAMAQDGNYRVRAGDKLAIEVLQDPSLNRAATVLPDGRFSFPLAGTVPASGRTIGQIQSALSQALASNFNAAPDVFIAVDPAVRTPVAPRAPAAPPTVKIYFLGEVGTPGVKELPVGTTILQALATSGGFTNFAATKRVQLRRTSIATGLQSVFEIDYDALANGAQLRNDVPLQDGDVVLVPERRLFE